METNSNIKYIKYTVNYDNKYVGYPNTCDSETTIPRKCTLLSGFINEEDEMKMYIKGKQIVPMNSSLKITPDSIIELPSTGPLRNHSPSYKIKLELENTKKTAENNKILFENEITIINN